jgi:hypothetical protein
MSPFRSPQRHSTAVLILLLIAVSTLPATAGARPTYDGPGYKLPTPAEHSNTAPTVVRTVVKEDAVNVLTIALAGAALVIAITGTGVALARIAPLRRQFRAQP